MKIFMNGRLVPEKSAKVSVFDHGLLYGDGVFEGIRAYSGLIFKLEEHIHRLYLSAKAIALEIPMSEEEMCAAVVRTCKANGLSDAYVRLVVTRGVGTLGLNPHVCRDPQIIIIAAGIQLYPKKLYQKGLSIVTVATTRNMAEAVNPRIKSLNYLNNILGKIEALNAGVMEAIMLNSNGFVAEATGENIFIVRGNTLLTPPPWCGILEGITRAVVMELAVEKGYTAREEVLTRYDLYTADEVFLTGTAAEVIGVVDIDRRKIGNGKPGPVSRKLAKLLNDYASKNGTAIK